MDRAPIDIAALVSDLHLSPARPDIAAAFLRFLAADAPRAQTLFILGDLFEYWLGDDDLADPFNRSVADALSQLGRRGTAVSLMHGNRDFLLGAEFCRQAGAALLDDPCRVNIAGTPTLLTHGDALCTDDVEYQAFRARTRDRQWQRSILRQSLAERRALAESLREHSDEAKRGKPAAIMDVNDAAVADLLRTHGYPRLIHGHTHRPARHEHQVDGRRCERWVLPDWYASGGGLWVSAQGVQPFMVQIDSHH